MEIKIFETKAALDIAVAGEIIDLITKNNNPLICPASGDSPAGIYKILIENKHSFDAQKCKFIGLDEWVGMNETDKGSCFYGIKNELFDPLEIKKENYYFFDGRSENLEIQCVEAEDFIKTNQGINLAILGIGLNGHIAMNEPGTDENARTQVVNLHESTKTVGQKYFETQTNLNEGITLGLGTLRNSDKIIIIATGSHKAEIIQKLINSEETNELPATLLKSHKDVSLYLDKKAAELL